jgi:hypothetical protein
MPQIGTSGSMSGDGRRSDCPTAQATAPILDSTHAEDFCTSLRLACADDPSVWIGVRQLAVQRVWD